MRLKTRIKSWLGRKVWPFTLVYDLGRQIAMLKDEIQAMQVNVPSLMKLVDALHSRVDALQERAMEPEQCVSAEGLAKSLKGICDHHGPVNVAAALVLIMSEDIQKDWAYEVESGKFVTLELGSRPDAILITCPVDLLIAAKRGGQGAAA